MHTCHHNSKLQSCWFSCSHSTITVLACAVWFIDKRYWWVAPRRQYNEEGNESSVILKAYSIHGYFLKKYFVLDIQDYVVLSIQIIFLCSVCIFVNFSRCGVWLVTMKWKCVAEIHSEIMSSKSLVYKWRSELLDFSSGKVEYSQWETVDAICDHRWFDWKTENIRVYNFHSFSIAKLISICLLYR